ncbi:MAG: hypothetical protein KAI24_08950 [Planctomycetes bacterium]|nr:hypothetical protein [Planctomycetota bacterium]
MASATCVRCAARQPIGRIYAAITSSQPNILAIRCAQCGEVSSQLRTLGDYLTFAVVYGGIALLFVVLGMRVGPDVDTAWIATIAAVLPYTFLPAWWGVRMGPRLAAIAPAEEIGAGERVLYLLVALTVIGAIIGAGLLGYLLLLA